MVHEYTLNGKWKWLFTCNENTNPNPTFPHNINAKLTTCTKHTKLAYNNKMLDSHKLGLYPIHRIF
jgi:hypothetical protein